MQHLIGIFQKIAKRPLSDSEVEELTLAYKKQIEADEINDEEKEHIINMRISEKKALLHAVSALWFADSSDYSSYFNQIIQSLMQPFKPDEYIVSQGKISAIYDYLKTPLTITINS